ncbi:unnamed protein product [Cyclocybe aegerita]|uniref:Zn(2)-C6 fungal-type domain-containing protein n=1 Tax=Cyclocybe aegerita TaxID=1973307 RepID=A0A8S0XIJ4_CYCAE|nr:unnamed protein product [Cyclocybe aegerita]
MSYNHPHIFRQDDLEFPPPVQYQCFPDYASPPDRYADSAAGETRPALYPSSSSQIHPHPLFTRQHNTTADDPTSQNHPLDPHVLASHHQLYQSSSPFTNIQPHQQPQRPHESPQSWPPYEPPQIHQPFPQSNLPLSYAPYHNPPPFPNRLSPPPPSNQPFQFKGSNHSNAGTSAVHRMSLAGSLDPATGIFYRTPEHPRLRTAQACEKCRTRKAKCSGEHPACKRCLARGLVCEYAKEGRVRGPNKPKAKMPPGGTGGSGSDGRSTPKGATGSGGGARGTSRNRTSSANSSAGSSDHPDLPPAVRAALQRAEQDSSPSRRNGKRNLGASRRNSLSLGEHRSNRPRPPDLHLDSPSSLYRISTGEGPRSASAVGGGMPDPGFMSFHHHAQGKGEFVQDDMGQQFHRNVMASSSGSSLKRIHRGMHDDQTTPLALPPTHNLVPVGMHVNIGSNDHQMGEELVYPPPEYYHHHPRPSHDESGHALPGSFSNQNVGASSPQTSTVSAETTSTLGSPLTPSSASTPSLLPPGMLPHHPQHQGGGMQAGLDFELDPQLAPHSVPASQQVTPDGKQHHHSAGDSPLAMHKQYHSAMDLHMC